MKQLALPALATIAIVGCGKPEPRGTQYFETHIEEARQVSEGCRDGSVRGGECENADRAIAAVEARERTRRFLGK